MSTQIKVCINTRLIPLEAVAEASRRCGGLLSGIFGDSPDGRLHVMLSSPHLMDSNELIRSFKVDLTAVLLDHLAVPAGNQVALPMGIDLTIKATETRVVIVLAPQVHDWIEFLQAIRDIRLEAHTLYVDSVDPVDRYVAVVETERASLYAILNQMLQRLVGDGSGI